MGHFEAVVVARNRIGKTEAWVVVAYMRMVGVEVVEAANWEKVNMC